MAGITENVTYTNQQSSAPAVPSTYSKVQELSKSFKPMVNRAYDLGASLPDAPRQKAFNTSGFSGVGAQGQEYGSPTPSNPTTPTNLSSLGTLTVPYMGATKFEQHHPALDIANKIGTNIPAFTGGKVTEVVTGKKQGDKGYGNSIVVTDPQGNKHRYSHLSKEYVKIGDTINPGQTIGEMGNSGSTYSTSGGTGSHLDYRVMDAYNKWVNPSQFIK